MKEIKENRILYKGKGSECLYEENDTKAKFSI